LEAKILNIEYKNEIDEGLGKLIGAEFSKYAEQNNVASGYEPFCFVAKEGEEIAGILAGHSFYKEVYIGELIIVEQYRRQHIGSKLLEAVEDFYKGKGFENLNLSTYAFQAPEFYKKCGYSLEFVRANADDPKLDKYFFIKRYA
jgi:GNAT superfamily N-acetyltransferase